MGKAWISLFSYLLFTFAIQPVSANEDIDPKNHLSLFGGITHTDGDNAGTIGLDYERRVSERVGIGVVFRDHAAGDIDSTLYAISFIGHFWPPWSFVVAPGVEREDGESSAVVRVGVEYEIEMDEKWSLAPALYFDIGEDETKEVLGAAIGFSF